MEDEALGIDFGGVITDRANDRTDTSFFGPNFRDTTPVEGAFQAIRTLVRERFTAKVYIVSKAGQRTQEKTRQWMEVWDFYHQTGITAENVFFCIERRDKAAICENLGVTHYIDDRLEVLNCLATVPNRYLFQGEVREVDRNLKGALPFVVVNNWEEVVREILG